MSRRKVFGVLVTIIIMVWFAMPVLAQGPAWTPGMPWLEVPRPWTSSFTPVINGTQWSEQYFPYPTTVQQAFRQIAPYGWNPGRVQGVTQGAPYNGLWITAYRTAPAMLGVSMLPRVVWQGNAAWLQQQMDWTVH